MVARLGAPLTGWPAPMSYGAAGSVPLATEAGQGAGRGTRRRSGSPWTSLPTPMSPSARRPHHRGPVHVRRPCAAGNLSVGFSQGMLAAGVLPAVKHFPGHGSVTVDSHKDLPVQKATVAQLKARDWKPFQAAIAAGSP